MKNNRLIVVAGPTASGKSAVGVKLAKMLDTEIISADSMQIYEGFDVGTAKITKEECEGVTHYMLSTVSPHRSYSVNDYTIDAKKIIDDIQTRGKIPILCGGTGLYINSVIYNFDLREHNSDPALRAELEEEYKKKGGEYLLDILRAFDPETAERLHPNNYRRIIRAIEIYRVSGITISQQRKLTEEAPKEYDTDFFVLNTNREVLYERINKRVDKMIEQGLVEEVKNLFNLGISKNATSMQAIGYKEFAQVIDGEMTVEEATEKIKLESRRYAKRQLTWFRRNEEAHWINTEEFNDDPQKIAEYILTKIK